MALYYGFSTYGRQKKFKLTDFDLAKQDLFNYLNIRKGEKLMHPDFGTIIWGLLFEPLTAEVKSVIQDELQTILSYDPRLQADNIVIAEYQHGLQIQIDLIFTETDERDTMVVNFDKSTVGG
jgi:phage baseplate assembly protein W